MTRTILITGATDGIGLLTAQMLVDQGHRILLHGRSQEKLDAAAQRAGIGSGCYLADLSRLDEVRRLADEVRADHGRLDILINNAGVLKAPDTKTEHGFDIRFVVNTFAPYLLTKLLLPIMPESGRVVNLSSAAQAPVDPEVLLGQKQTDDMSAYAQSKLALTLWSGELARVLPDGPIVVAVNPGSLLASKMVKEGFGIAGNDLAIGAKILCEAALDPSFEDASGRYFDNDSGRFAAPNAAAQDPDQIALVMAQVEQVASSWLPSET